MAQETSPAFQFYVKEWRSSRAILRMTFAERGMYLEMLLEQWENLTLPDDPKAVAHLIGGNEAEWVAAWPVLRRKFVDRRALPRTGEPLPIPVDYDAGRQIVNLKLEKIRKEQRAYRKGKKLAGKAGGEAKARNKQQAHDLTLKQNVAVLGSATSSGLAKASPPTPTATATAPPSATASAIPRHAGKEPPLQLGLQRFKVWRWMLDDCIGTLGTHADAFNLPDWLEALDRSDSCIVPEVWPWLRNEMLAEAGRRGLPIAGAVVLGKQTSRLAAAVANIQAAEAK